ncbi:hypothetical protein LH464_05135 [Neorhizobium sp. T786]|nr:hypothetical protein [Neorhizobium xiangyangii]
MGPCAASATPADAAAAAVAAHAVATGLGSRGTVAAPSDQIAVGMRGTGRKRPQQSGSQREAARRQAPGGQARRDIPQGAAAGCGDGNVREGAASIAEHQKRCRSDTRKQGRPPRRHLAVRPVGRTASDKGVLRQADIPSFMEAL